MLTENEYIWAISEESLDDGRSGYIGYYTDRDRAYKLANKLHFRSGGLRKLTVVQTTLWKDEEGNWFRCEPREVSVDLPEKKDVLAKLTQQERKALGF